MSPIVTLIRSTIVTGSETVIAAVSAVIRAIVMIATATPEGLLLSRGPVAAEDDELSN